MVKARSPGYPPGLHNSAPSHAGVDVLPEPIGQLLIGLQLLRLCLSKGRPYAAGQDVADGRFCYRCLGECFHGGR